VPGNGASVAGVRDLLWEVHARYEIHAVNPPHVGTEPRVGSSSVSLSVIETGIADVHAT
jgi:hypothetical protein